MRRSFSPGIHHALVIVLTFFVAALLFSVARSHTSLAGRAGIADDKPLALASHLDRLKTIPGNLGESPDGPASAAEQAFLQRAYPDTDIPLANTEGARAAYATIAGRGFPTGKGRPGTWVSVGPSTALYPATIFRSSFSYVPASYVASGRTTSLAISPICVQGHCTVFAGPAGGGIWRTKNAIDGEPAWQFVSGPFGINAIGSIAFDPNDPAGNTVWVGTGEANASADSEAGVGLYKSTDGGDTWTGPLGTSAFNARSVGTIAIKSGDPNIIYAGTTRGVRGISSVSGGSASLAPGAPDWGLYKSIDGGTTWTLIHNGAATLTGCSPQLNVANNVTPCSPRGVRRVVIDPTDPNTVYAGSYARGVWRSNDAGTTWTQIDPPLVNTPTNTSSRPEIAVNTLPNGDTRMYVGEGASGSPYSRLFRSDSVRTGSPTFTQLTSSNKADAGYGSYNYCEGQCWYDNFVVSPAGYPDVVYLGGSYAYNETGRVSNGRGVVLSTDAGVSFTDMTMDATDPIHPNGLHPDQHFLVTNPNNPYQFIESNDGGIMRSSGAFADVSSWCDSRNLTDPALSRCHQLLSSVPTGLQSLNKGLSTLQFQSLSVNPFNVNDVQGGTQDNGTWESTGNPVKWINTMIGDGGQSGFDVANKQFRFHTFYDAQPDVNFSGGDMSDWNWIGDPFFLPPFNTESRSFYIPIISDPVVSQTMYAGLGHVGRTKTWGMGTMDVATYRQHCNEWFGDFPLTVTCGDWVPLGDPTSAGKLTSSSYGSDRTGNYVAAVQRATGNTGTLWAATYTGRVFVSTNADAEPASAVTFTRIDSASTPGRFVTGIAIDPANANHAWISYSGYNATTPSTTGHVFEVTYDPGSATATWADRSYDLADLPITAVAFDSVTGDLYAASDFGVLRLAAETTSWTAAAPGMPQVEVAGLTIVPGARKLYAATHGLGAWLLNLP